MVSPTAIPVACSASRNRPAPPHTQPTPPSMNGHVGPNRRGLLAAAGGALALPHTPARATTIIQVDGNEVPLHVVALRGSMPAQWPADFQSMLPRNADLRVTQRNHLSDIFSQLSSGNKEVARADAITLGDAFLHVAIQRRLLQPIDHLVDRRWWGELSPRWQQLVTRDMDGMPAPLGKGGRVWGAPYRWGCTTIAVRQQLVEKSGAHPVVDWADLLQPQLQKKVACTDAPREYIGLALKTLSLPLNASARDVRAAGLSEADVVDAVRRVRSQLLLLSSRDHLRALTSGDAYCAVGWSPDVLTIAARSPDTHVIVPASGTALWADIWTVPAGAGGGSGGQGPSPLLPLWLEHGLAPQRVQRLQGLAPNGASPQLLTECGGAGRAGNCASALRAPGPWQPPPPSEPRGWMGSGSPWLPPPDVMQRSEFLLPLDAETLAMYQRLLRVR